MKIEIVTERKPFFDGESCEMGQIIDCSAEEGKALISNGFAIETAKKTVKKK